MAFPESIQVPNSGPINGSVIIPGSKSITNRAILIAALARGTSRLRGILHSDDTKYMLTTWDQLGVTFNDSAGELVINGCDGKPNPCSESLYVGNAGTAARFLTAVLTLGQGQYQLSGNDRMQKRPIRDLIEALNTLGAEVSDLTGSGCPPVKVVAGRLKGGKVQIPGDKSSQYISALMMTAPYAEAATRIEILGDLVSRTYVELTQSVMADFGVHCQWLNHQELEISPGQHYQATDFAVEGDASSASYFMGMAAITHGTIKIMGVRKDSQQGDLGLLDILEDMGCRIIWETDGVVVEGNPLRAVEVDMNTMSDVAPTLAVIALFAEGETRILNVGNMRIKECDRIEACVTELRKLGAQVTEWEDGLSITGMGKYKSAVLDTYDDHRMAMSLSLAGLIIPGVTIQNPECVTKTFPDFYERFLPLLTPEVRK
jgi:3-phosphoshikimate 1-carboxyvinyltransferase